MLMLDEMQITKGLDFDPSTGMLLGRPTVPLANNTLPESCYATHALVFMLGGISTRWKQAIAYELTGHSFHAETVKDKLNVIITTCESVGLKIHGIVSDMGPCNRALWRLYGIQVTKTKRQCYAPHPNDASRNLYFVADAPHLLKNLRGHLTKGHKIHLPADVVAKMKLPTDVVSIQHVEQLVELEEDSEFRLAPRLKKSCLSSGHYDKMKVGPAYSLLNHDTAAALRYHAKLGNLDKEAETTAWFFDKVHAWFTMVTSRTRKQAERHLGTQGDTFFHEVISLFENMKIVGNDGSWKPVQTGIILTTMSVMQLQEHLLVKEGFFFVLLSRFGQDSLENFFSTLRMNNPVPSPREFKCALRSASLSQFMRPNPKGNYACSDGKALVGIGDKSQHSWSGTIFHPTPRGLENMVLEEGFKYVCGYAVSQVKKNFRTCRDCAVAITGSTLDIEENDWLRVKSYVPHKVALVLPSKAALELLQLCEAYFLGNVESILQSRISLIAIKKDIFENMVTNIPSCHNVPRKLVNVFLRTRMHIFLRKKNDAISKEEPQPKCGSRSIGMRDAAKGIK